MKFSKPVIVGIISIVGVAIVSIVAFASATGYLLPVSDGFYLQWITSTSTQHFVNVDESPVCNGNTDYNFTDTVGNRDSYGISLSGLSATATITELRIVPCASKNHNINASSTMNVFYRFNGVNSADAGNYDLTGITPFRLGTTTFSGLSLAKDASSTLEIGVVFASTTATSSPSGARLSAIAVKILYSP